MFCKCNLNITYIVNLYIIPYRTVDHITHYIHILYTSVHCTLFVSVCTIVILHPTRYYKILQDRVSHLRYCFLKAPSTNWIRFISIHSSNMFKICISDLIPGHIFNVAILRPWKGSQTLKIQSTYLNVANFGSNANLAEILFRASYGSFLQLWASTISSLLAQKSTSMPSEHFAKGAYVWWPNPKAS